MAFDGICVYGIVNELKEKLTGGRIYKIAQPEKNELLLTIKNEKNTYKLLISANASLPLTYITENNKVSPMVAPNFCMLLRKYINNARILDITQPGLERIINISLSHLNELGDLCNKTIVIELMGKHSNIIFIDDKNNIVDAIKHVSIQMSSVREVLPGRDYFIPADDKLNPLTVDENDFINKIKDLPHPLSKAIYFSFTGISPIISEEIINLSSIDSNRPANCLEENEYLHLAHTFINFIDEVKNKNFKYTIYYKDGAPVEYSIIPLSIYKDFESLEYDTISEMLEKYYEKKEIITNIRKNSSDLRGIITTALSKAVRKADLQAKQLKDTEKRDKYKLYGELITAYSYLYKEGDKFLECENYYDNNNPIKIPMDETLTPIENANKNFKKYNKLKRTYEALTEIIVDTKKEIAHLESILCSLDIATTNQDLIDIKHELTEYGYIKKHYSKKKKESIGKPVHIKIDDYTDIYIGKNNLQNEEVTFKIGTGNDWWFHTKNVPGSHVIVKTKKDELDDNMFEIAGGIAAYFSKSRDAGSVEIDYTQRKNIKHVPNSAPGFVIYHTNYSMLCTPLNPYDYDYEIL